jgi:glycosyltransferase involved in cell wall biosynthesis
MTRRFLESGQREPAPNGVARMRQVTGCQSVPRAELRVLFVSRGCYLETSNGAAIATQAMMECLARHGCGAEALSGTLLQSDGAGDLPVWLAEQGLEFESVGGPGLPTDSPVSDGEVPPHYRLHVRNVGLTLHRCPTTSNDAPDDAECQAFLRLLDEILERHRPSVVVSYGGDDLAVAVRGRARSFGAAVVCPLHHLSYRNAAAFADADAVMVPSRFAAAYYRKTLGLECTVLPNLIDFERARAVDRVPRYVTFVNPSYEKGVYVFAKMADELGRRRPDIRLLVVEARGSERTLVDCGLDLTMHRNVSVMSHTTDPRRFWSVTRLCVMPSLCWENQPLVAIEAMLNGIPVIGSDRGGIPETLGDGGIVLGLPHQLTPSTRELPTSREVQSWVKAVIALWDDPDWCADQGRRAVAESRRWASDVLERQYVRFFQGLQDSAAMEHGG